MYSLLSKDTAYKNIVADDQMLSERNKLLWAVKRPAVLSHVQAVAGGAHARTTATEQYAEDYKTHLSQQHACCDYGDKRANVARSVSEHPP